jgi:tetratricopeptide (TPR) repeat protein
VSEEEPREAAGEQRPWLFYALSLLLVAGLYVQVLGGPFIWDDRPLILEASGIRELNVARFFTQPLWAEGELASAAYYRPLVSLSFALDYQLHGENSGGYHLTNLIWHLLACGLVFSLLRRRGVALTSSFLLATTWALLPRLTEGAAWISGRADVMAGALTLAALGIYRPNASALRLGAASVLAFLALSCKEIGLSAFVALGLSVWLHRDAALGSPQAVAKPPIRAWLILAAPIVFYAALRGAAGAYGTGETLRLGLLGRAATVAESAGRYVWMLVDFVEPKSYLGWLGRPHYGYVALGLLALAGSALLARRWRSLARDTWPWLVTAALPLLLVSHLLPLPISVVAADRYLYLPSAALLLAGAPWLEQQLQLRRALVAALLALLLACGARSFERVGDYTDEARFWGAAVEESPEQALAFAELGSVAYRAGCFADALVVYKKALAVGDGRSSVPLENAALLAAINGEHALGAELGDRLLRAFPGRPELELRRATVALSALELDRAKRHAERALELDRRFVAAQSFVELVREVADTRAALEAGKATPSEALSLEVRALRFPEAGALLKRMLDDPRADSEALHDGVELFVAKGDPREAAPLLERYLARPDAKDVERLQLALAERQLTAQNVRERLRALAARGAFETVAVARP